MATTNDSWSGIEGLRRSLASEAVVDRAGSMPVYLVPEIPFWFVPNGAAHEILQSLMHGASTPGAVERHAASRGVSREAVFNGLASLARSIALPEPRPYPGRGSKGLENLSEVWYHLTDRCNLSCRHCLFACGPGGSRRTLERKDLESSLAEALDLGCRLFCFTGGEPLVYPGLTGVLGRLLETPGVRAVLLTNGTLVPDFIDPLCRLDRSRIHLQVSLDGPEEVNDALRGAGTFRRIAAAVELLRAREIPCSTVMAVNAAGVAAMADFVRLSGELGVETVHFLWHFARGKGGDMEIPPVDRLAGALRRAAGEAARRGMAIDNVEALRAQVFSHPGTRFDLTGAGFESLAIGPDGAVYPTPVLVGVEGMRAGHAGEGLERVWKSSPLFERLRRASLLDIPEAASHPWRFILGGADIDHGILHAREEAPSRLVGPDPYLPLYREIALMLIEEEASRLPAPRGTGLILRMGDITTECPSGAEVNFIHGNCLLSVGDGGARALVREFYRTRAEEPDAEILNPVRYAPEEVDFIPRRGLVRMYGCGSPVRDARPAPGEVLVDLGSGSGVECFLAAKEVGPAGAAVGVDMTDAMLEIARRSRDEVAAALGYANTSFLKGLLEKIPLADETADVVISNCVINLCHNKRRVFQEIFRILKPGGRFVIADVVCETPPPPAIRADHRLLGECIAGAMVQDYLFTMLSELGFAGARMVKRFPYRTVQGHDFFSLTFTARRPAADGERTAEVVYGGPFKGVVTEEGTVLWRGRRAAVPRAAIAGDETPAAAGLYVLDGTTGSVANAGMGSSCCCAAPGNAAAADPLSTEEDPSGAGDCSCGAAPEEGTAGAPPHATGCIVCGAPLAYLPLPEEQTCVKCGRRVVSDARCAAGHFVCDLCHREDPLKVIRSVCAESRETDMLRMMEAVRGRPSFAMHGPEHHALVPGVILATYRNLGGAVDALQVSAAIDRGALLPGGSCGYMGGCSAAIGAGVAFAMLLESNPLNPEPRRLSQKITARILDKVADIAAVRCCRRECAVVLTAAAEISKEYLPIELRAEGPAECGQFRSNPECLGKECPFFPSAADPASGAGS